MSVWPAVVKAPVPKLALDWKVPVTTTLPLASTAMPRPTSSRSPPPSFDHRWAPVGEYFATNTSLPAKPVTQPAPRSIEFWKEPVTSTFPLASHATPLPACVASALPKAFDQIGSPAAEYFARKMSVAPTLVSGPVPKSMVPLNFPVTSTLPLASTATARPAPPPRSPPKHFVHTEAPVAVYFERNIEPGRHTTPLPKSTMLSTRPVITALPLASSATPYPTSLAAPPKPRAHGVPPAAPLTVTSAASLPRASRSSVTVSFAV